MIDIEDQVCNLEYAMQLQELGIRQESLFCWCGENEHIKVMLNEFYDSNCNPRYKICSAFTASELGQILPIHVTLKEEEPFNNFRLFITTALLHVGGEFKKSYIVNYECDSQSIDNIFKNYLDKNKHDTNLANAMAKMLIFLIENKLIEIP